MQIVERQGEKIDDVRKQRNTVARNGCRIDKSDGVVLPYPVRVLHRTGGKTEW